MNLVRYIRPLAVVGAALGLGCGPAIAYMTPTVPVCGSSSCNVTVAGGGILESLSRAKPFAENRLFAGASVFDVSPASNGLAGRLHALRASAPLLSLSPFSTLMTTHAAVSGDAGNEAAPNTHSALLRDFHIFSMPASGQSSQPEIVPVLQSLHLTAPGILTAGLRFQLAAPRDVTFLTPAPGTLALLGLGALGLYGIGRRGFLRPSGER